MGKSRFEGMEIAIRERAKIAEASADDKVRIETLKAELQDIDKDTLNRIEEIKNTPIDKNLLKKQAQLEKENKININERECSETILLAENRIKQAELQADILHKQALLDIEKQRTLLKNTVEKAKEQKQRNDIIAEQQYETVIASIDNAEKTLTLRIKRETEEGEKRKRNIEIELRSLEARNNIIEEQKNNWERFYNDTVEISKTLQSQRENVN